MPAAVAAAFLAVLVVISLPAFLERATVNNVTSPPPVLRDCRVPSTVMAIRKNQVTNSASSEAATETWPLVWLLT